MLYRRGEAVGLTARMNPCNIPNTLPSVITLNETKLLRKVSVFALAVVECQAHFDAAWCYRVTM